MTIEVKFKGDIDWPVKITCSGEPKTCQKSGKCQFRIREEGKCYQSLDKRSSFTLCRPTEQPITSLTKRDGRRILTVELRAKGGGC